MLIGVITLAILVAVSLGLQVVAVQMHRTLVWIAWMLVPAAAAFPILQHKASCPMIETSEGLFPSCFGDGDPLGSIGIGLMENLAALGVACAVLTLPAAAYFFRRSQA